MWRTRVLYAVLCLFVFCDGRTFSRCKLVRELLNIGMPADMFLAHWVCLIEQESGRDTSAYRKSPSNKEYYGLYQIPSQWCKKGKPGGLCNVACESLLSDNIEDATRCALQIMNAEGFKYWNKWVQRCKNNIGFYITEIYKCPDLINLPRSMSRRHHKRSTVEVKDLRRNEIDVTADILPEDVNVRIITKNVTIVNPAEDI